MVDAFAFQCFFYCRINLFWLSLQEVVHCNNGDYRYGNCRNYRKLKLAHARVLISKVGITLNLAVTFKCVKYGLKISKRKCQFSDAKLSRGPHATFINCRQYLCRKFLNFFYRRLLDLFFLIGKICIGSLMGWRRDFACRYCLHISTH